MIHVRIPESLRKHEDLNNRIIAQLKSNVVIYLRDVCKETGTRKKLRAARNQGKISKIVGHKSKNFNKTIEKLIFPPSDTATNGVSLESESYGRGKRVLKNVPNYYEYDETDDDDRYIYCDFCEEEYFDGCAIHPLKEIYDNVVKTKRRSKHYAKLTLPRTYLKFDKSVIQEAGIGVFATKFIPMGYRFGPYMGVENDLDNAGYYAWQIHKNGKIVNFIDGFKESKSNWMRYVNCARNSEEQNIMAFIYRGKIFYRTVRMIPKDCELLVFYGNRFAKDLKINTKNFHYLSKPEPKTEK